MPQSVLDLIFRTKQEGTGTKAVSDDLKNLKTGLAGAVENLTGFSISSLGVAGVIAGLGAAIKGAITDTSEYARQVGDLSRVSGASAEESSRLIQVADDLQVSYETLTQAAKAAAKNGIALTTEELIRLQGQYQSIPNAADRAKFAMDMFGKSGTEMQKILEMDSAAFKDMADGVEQSMIMTEDQVKAAKDLERGLDNLGDMVKGVGYQVGNFLVKGLNDALSAINLMINANKIVQKTVEDHREAVVLTSKSYEEYVYELIRTNLAQNGTKKSLDEVRISIEKTGRGIDYAAESAKAKTRADWEAIRAQDELNKELVQAQLVLENETNAYYDSGSAGKDYTNIVKNLTAAVAEADKQMKSTVTDAMQPLTSEMLDQKIMATLSGDALLEYALKTRRLNTESYNTLRALQDLTKEFDTNKNGVIDATEMTEAYWAALQKLNGTSAHVTITTTHVTHNVAYGDPVDEPTDTGPTEPGWGSGGGKSGAQLTAAGMVANSRSGPGGSVNNFIFPNATIGSSEDIESLAMRLDEIRRRNKANGA